MKKTSNKLTKNIITIIMLSICLCLTTFAIGLSELSINNNLFNSGKVKINLNNGELIFTNKDLQLSPGMTLEKYFSLKNESSSNVYYKLYFENVCGGLEDVMEITIKDGDNILFSGTPSELNHKDVSKCAEGSLAIKEDKKLKIEVYFPKEKGNTFMNKEINFDICADAVQTKNNSKKSFN